MPRGIPNAKPSAGAAQSHASSVSIWDAFAAAALTGMLNRNNQASSECVTAACNAADLMMAEREKRFGHAADEPEEPAA